METGFRPSEKNALARRLARRMSESLELSVNRLRWSDLLVSHVSASESRRAQITFLQQNSSCQPLCSLPRFLPLFSKHCFCRCVPVRSYGEVKTTWNRQSCPMGESLQAEPAAGGERGANPPPFHWFNPSLSVGTRGGCECSAARKERGRALPRSLLAT